MKGLFGRGEFLQNLLARGDRRESSEIIAFTFHEESLSDSFNTLQLHSARK